MLNQDSKVSETLEVMKNKLIASEKLAVLGRLTAGILHEINSPLGVINASTGNLREAVSFIRENLITILFKINQEKIDAVCLLISMAGEIKDVSSKEERARKNKMIGYLEEAGIENAKEHAAILVDMGIYEDVSNILKIFGDDIDIFLQFTYNIVALVRNTEQIAESSHKASKLVQAVKNFGHSDHRGGMTSLNVSDGIEVVLRLYNHLVRNKITIERNFKDVPKIKGNKEELNQVWTNLILNSIQAMDEVGILHIDIYHEGNNVVVAITDSGCGIPEQVQARIFEPFFTTKPEGQGTGLGLDIVKKIVEKHSGTIHFDSMPGKTTFFVKIPGIVHN